MLLGLAAYANALKGPFVFDDVNQIRDVPLVHDLGHFLRTGYGAMPARFVTYLTFAIDWRLGGGTPGVFHVFNVAVHLANALLVYALATAILRTPRVGGSAIASAPRTVAFGAAALFVVHPIQTQAVTYVVQRVTSLSTLFYLAALVLYACWRTASPSAGRLRRSCYVLALLSTVLGMHAKEIAFTLPVTVVLFELSFFDPRPGRWKALAPFLATALIVPFLVVMRGQTGSLATAVLGAADATRVQSQLGRVEYLATELPVIVTYLFLLLLPVGQNLDHDYPIHGSFLDVEVLSSAAVLLALAALAAYLYARTRRGARVPADPGVRVAAFGIAWWFVTLSVESSFVPIVDVINEHRVYLPSAGAFLAAAVGGLFLARRLAGAPQAPRIVTIAVVGLCAVLTLAARARNEVWASDVALWNDAAQKSPRKARPALNLGTALAEAGRYREAVAPLRRAAELDPSWAYVHAQLAAVLLRLGQADQAEPELREALRLAPQDAEATFNLAAMLWQAGRREEAGPWFRRFLQIAPAGLAEARRVAEAHASR